MTRIDDYLADQENFLTEDPQNPWITGLEDGAPFFPQPASGERSPTHIPFLTGTAKILIWITTHLLSVIPSIALSAVNQNMGYIDPLRRNPRFCWRVRSWELWEVGPWNENIYYAIKTDSLGFGKSIGEVICDNVPYNYLYAHFTTGEMRNYRTNKDHYKHGAFVYA